MPSFCLLSSFPSESSAILFEGKPQLWTASPELLQPLWSNSNQPSISARISFQQERDALSKLGLLLVFKHALPIPIPISTVGKLLSLYAYRKITHSLKPTLKATFG